MKSNIKRECEYCGSEFTIQNGNQRYCSKECLREVQRGKSRKFNALYKVHRARERESLKSLIEPKLHIPKGNNKRIKLIDFMSLQSDRTRFTTNMRKYDIEAVFFVGSDNKKYATIDDDGFCCLLNSLWHHYKETGNITNRDSYKWFKNQYNKFIKEIDNGI